MLPEWTNDSAHFTDPQHRVWLRRRVEYPSTDYETPRVGFKPLIIIGHNPSVAGLEGVDDPTMRRALGFARSSLCTDLVMVNAATGVATDADNLWKVREPFYYALAAIEVAAEFAGPEGIICAAWGAPKGGTKYNKELMLAQYRRIKVLGLPLHTLRITKNGFPEHPLYLPKDLRPQPWSYPCPI